MLKENEMSGCYSGYIGSVFLDENQIYQYRKPLPGVAETLEEVCKCPLCGSKKFIMLGKFSIDQIIDMWVERANFNPIADVYRHKILEKRRCLDCGLHFYNYHLPDSNTLYEQLMKAIPYYPNFRWEYGLASQYIAEHGAESLIEIGAGTGCFIERVQNMVSYALASEYNQDALNVCRQKELHCLGEDVSRIKDKFDVVCAFEVLEHVWDNHKFMENCIRLLKKGSKLIFGTPDPEGILSVNGIGFLNLPPHHQFDFSYQAFEYLAQKYGLKIVEYQKSELQYRHYARYVENLTGKTLSEPDIPGFVLTRKQFSGHSHFVVFEK